MKNMILEDIKKCLIKSAVRTNYYAHNVDQNKNNTNYGSTTAYANILRKFGVIVDLPVYETKGFMRIPKIVINSEIIRFEL